MAQIEALGQRKEEARQLELEFQDVFAEEPKVFVAGPEEPRSGRSQEYEVWQMKLEMKQLEMQERKEEREVEMQRMQAGVRLAELGIHPGEMFERQRSDLLQVMNEFLFIYLFIYLF